MGMRRGQVALYLIAVLAGIAMLVVMNVNVFLAVRAKNRATNAGDAAALAVARYQGELLNMIGEDNVEHMLAAIDGDAQKCEEIMERQKRNCFLAPLEGIRIGNEAAENNGIEAAAGGSMRRILQNHVSDIRNVFSQSPELYPEPWPGAWEKYAQNLETVLGTLGAGLLVGPDNCEFADAWTSFPLVYKQFYNAIAGRNWCWFHFNGEYLLDMDSSSLPRPNFEEPTPRFNSEIYPLHLTFRNIPVVTEEWREIIHKVTGRELDLANIPPLVTNETQVFAFYDYRWDRWSTYPGICFNPDEFPIAGSVRSEYDVLGCAAICRVVNPIPSVDFPEGEKTNTWTAAAKPFGTVENVEGKVSCVTVLKRFVTPCFSDVRLVPIDAVGGRDLSTADEAWMRHVRDHLPAYFTSGPMYNGCWYCAQLLHWEDAGFRQQGKTWLKYHAGECVYSSGSGGRSGGTAHGH